MLEIEKSHVSGKGGECGREVGREQCLSLSFTLSHFSSIRGYRSDTDASNQILHGVPWQREICLPTLTLPFIFPPPFISLTNTMIVIDKVTDCLLMFISHR